LVDLPFPGSGIYRIERTLDSANPVVVERTAWFRTLVDVDEVDDLLFADAGTDEVPDEVGEQGVGGPVTDRAQFGPQFAEKRVGKVCELSNEATRRVNRTPWSHAHGVVSVWVVAAVPQAIEHGMDTAPAVEVTRELRFEVDQSTVKEPSFRSKLPQLLGRLDQVARCVGEGTLGREMFMKHQ
jgi:hypothetical protein